MQRVLGLLTSRFQVDIANYKLTTIRRRIERRMSLGRFDHMSAFADHLQEHPDALADLHRDLFIHVTEFFRDADAFVALRERIFPALVKERPKDTPIRIWVPGCSTGEEAYSLAIVLNEYIEKHSAPVRVQIFATDVSDAAIEKARKGVYDERVLTELGSVRLARFFEKTKEGFKIRKQIRELCIMSRHDVTSDPPFANLDLISCRNVLIYFGQDLQKRIIPVFHYALKQTGYLWLGRSETPGAFSGLFSPIDKQSKIYAKVTSPRSYPSTGTRPVARDRVDLPTQMPSLNGPLIAVQASADKVVLAKYAPPAVVISHDLDVLQFRGNTSPFLGPPKGQPTHNLLKMSHHDVLPALRALIQSAKKENATVRHDNITVATDSGRRSVNIEITPLDPKLPERERELLVVFEENVARAKGKKTGAKASAKANPRTKSTANKDDLIAELQQELDAARDYQQTLSAQFEAFQEELTSANEELHATNEEFQSTNEELETAKEELQSANEELTTTNDELQARNAELVAANEKLARGEDRFRLMVESIKDYAIYMLEPDGVVSSWNEGARRLKGYEASEILGEHYSRFFLPEDIAAKAPVIELERARIEGRYETEGWRLRKDGSRFWASVIVARVNDSTGSLIGFSKITRDLTERKRAEDELEQRERRFRLMISGVRDYAIFMLDPEWRVASWNEGARRLKGYTEGEIVGKHFSVFYPPGDIAAGKIEREVEAVMTDGRVEDEGWRVRKDGTRFWANVVITRVTDADGKLIGFTKVTRDLTERRGAEEALRATNETLEAGVRERTTELTRALKARDEFLSIASHELKTPLTGLKLQLQMAARAAQPGHGRPFAIEDAAKTFERALKQARALESLVDDLLDVSRIQSGLFDLAIERVDVPELIEEVVARFSAAVAEANSRVELDLEPGLKARWDERRVVQVLMNLIANALKYAPGSPIRVSAIASGANAKITVEDFGPGIAPDLLPTIFDRFERAGASHSVGGLGLGLFIARRIVETHNGTIRAESELGAGARFIIELPMEPGDLRSRARKAT